MPKARFEYDAYNFAVIFEPDLEQSETREKSLPESLPKGLPKSSSKSSSESLPKSLPKCLPKNALKILNFIKKDEKITLVQMANKCDISKQAVQMHINTLKELKLIQRIGPKKGGYWQVL